MANYRVTLKAFRLGKDGKTPHYLFHGNFGTTKVEFDKWLKADVKPVADGRNSTVYLSGFHSLPDIEAVERWKASTTISRVVVPVRVRKIRTKSHSKHEVVLSDYLYLAKKDWDKAVKCSSAKKYKGIKAPKCVGGVGCHTCWKIYNANHSL